MNVFESSFCDYFLSDSISILKQNNISDIICIREE